MRTTGRSAAQSGFTLLEILVALTVLGFLLVMLTEGARVGAALWHAQARRSAATADLDPAARVLRTILTTIPIEPAALAAPVAIEFKGRRDRLVLVGELPTGFGVNRRVDMTLGLSAGRLVIAWAPHRHDADANASAVTELLGGVRRLGFAYWGSLGPQNPAAWLDNWEGPALPQLVRIRIEFAAGDTRRWPDLVVAPQL